MKVILAHTRKPATENRITLKIACALSHVKKLEIKVLGVDGIDIRADYLVNGVEYLSPFKQRPKTFSILWNQGVLWRLITDWKPDFIVCCSPDLLPVSILAKWRFGTKIIFDCQENFALNFRYQKHSSGWNSILMSRLWSFALTILNRWIDRVWFAEHIYSAQLPGLSKKANVFENKLSTAFANKNLKSESQLFQTLTFTGVVSEESGAIKAAHFLSQFQTQFPDWKTQIIGFCPNLELKHRLGNIFNKPGQLLKIDHWESAKTILREVEYSLAVLMPYRESKANLGKIPTKFYEALYFGKPVLVQQGSDFANLAAKYGAGIEVNFNRPERNEWASIRSQILEYKPKTIRSADYLFDEEGLRNDFLRIAESGFKF